MSAPARLWAHMRKLWPRYTLLPPAPFVLWGAYRVSQGDVRFELIAAALVALGLAYGNERSKKLMIGVYPACLVGLLYDSMRFVKNVGLSESTVHVCDLRQHELALFGIHVGGSKITLQDWFQAHPNVVLDLISSVPYGTFIYMSLGYAVFLYFKDFTGLKRYAWTFLLMNVAAFVTYHIYPAAPPWYYHSHGCVVDLTTKASAGPNLMRVDALLGIHYFEAFYGRSNDIFGAVPSLHVAYPLLLLLEGRRHHGWAFKIGIGIYFVIMCFAAVYLDHHWVIDVILGLAYGAGIYGAMSWYFGRGAAGAADAPVGESGAVSRV